MDCERIVSVNWSPDCDLVAVVTITASTNLSGVTIRQSDGNIELHPSRPEAIINRVNKDPE